MGKEQNQNVQENNSTQVEVLQAILEKLTKIEELLSTPVIVEEKPKLKKYELKVAENEVKRKEIEKQQKQIKMGAVINSAYSGEVLDQLLVKATTGNQMVAGGHIRGRT